jgi:streptogrisin C
MTRRYSKSLLATLTLSLSAACGSQEPETQVPTAPVPVEAAAQEEALTLDEQFLRMAQKYPGFAGYYVDGEGRPVLMRAGGVRAAALDGLVQSLSQAHDARPVVEREAKYAFDELYAWHLKLVDVMSEPGSEVHYFDISEQDNALVLGITPGASANARAIIERFIVKTGVPRDAVQVREEPRARPHYTLREYANPVPGGTEISYSANGKRYVCSLGLPVKRGTTVGFVTAGHCSAANGQRFDQGNINYYLGNSVAVGPLVAAGTNGCPVNTQCKWADVAFASFASTSYSDRAKIAVTPGPNNLNVSGKVSVIQVLSTPAIGTGVKKTGRTTGTTEATMQASCVKLKYDTYPITFLCLNKVDTFFSTFSQGGDSGGPVWIVSGSGTASITGLISGGNEDGGVVIYNHSYYSPWSSIQKDLGTLSILY